MNFIAELRRRKVFRVAGAYLVAAWGLMQGVGFLIVALDLPDWTPRFLLILIVVGLVPALIAAWALEITPEGIKLQRDVDQSDANVPTKKSKIDYVIVGVLSLIIIGLIVERVFFADVAAPPQQTVLSTEIPKSVAVLPFADFSPDSNMEWFGDGLAEEILNALARTPDIMVSSRTSTFAFKGSDADVRTIARELGVAHVLEGSLRGGGGQMRITAQLIRASDNFHLWSQTYDIDTDDVIGVQEDVSLKIASALQTTLDPDALQDMMRVGTRSVSAYQAYIRGVGLRSQALRFADSGKYEQAYEQFELARNIDPKFAAAHRESAEYWKVLLNPTRGGTSTDLTAREILENFLERNEMAIDSTINSVDQRDSRGRRAATEMRLRAAIRNFSAYLDERPGDYRAWHELLIVAQIAADREIVDKALQALRSGGEFDRFAATTYVSTAYRFGAASSAADYGLKALQRWPNDAALSYQTHRSLLWAGRIDEAGNLLARMNDATLSSPLVRARQACAEGRRAEVVQMLEGQASGDRAPVAVVWTILMLLGETGKATALLQELAANGVTYQLGSWLVFHTFDPGPFPSLLQMLERENVRRAPAVPIPFACPPD